jgi:glycosyltransferase involved in cell wall biosynthesis
MPHTILVAHAWKTLTDHAPNGDGLFAYGLLRRLAERGHRLHVACRGVDLRDPPPPGIVFHRLSLHEEDHMPPRERVGYMRRLRALLGRLGDVDLCWQPNPVDAGISLALPASGPPLVLGPYWADWPGHSAGLGARGRRLMRIAQQRRAAGLLITTDAARDKVHVDVPVTVVPPGVEPADFPLAGPRPAERPPTAIFLANLRAHKGIFTLLEAFEAVAVRLPEAKLLVAGSGPDEEAVLAAIDRSPVSAGIEVLGRVERAAIPATMARADVSCQPAHGEPFGWSAVEAMACGLPVVVTDAGGLATVVPDDAGVKVAPGDPDALAAGLVEVLADPERCVAMGRAGRAAVERSFAWDRVVDRLEEALARAASAQRPRTAGPVG